MKRTIGVILGSLLAAAAATAGCGDLDPGDPQSIQGDPAPAADEDIGVIELAIQSVPPEVSCIRVTAKGPYREKVVDVPVVAGPSMNQVLTGFPLGKVTLRAEAFAGACDTLTTKSNAAWVSDPVEASIVEGTKTKVEFNMQRNGRLDVTFNFPEEPVCSAAGLACKSSKECCSAVCKTEVCQMPAS